MGCFTGKIGYATHDLAQSALLFAQVQSVKGRKPPVRVYYCAECGRYHLTSQKKREYKK